LVLAAEGGVRVQVLVGAPQESGTRSVAIHSRAHDVEDWTLHAQGELAEQTGEPGFDVTVWPPADAVTVAVEDLYERLAEIGLEYGPVFQGLARAWVRPGEVLAEIVLPEQAHAEAARFGVHPALLDAALHASALGDLLPAPEPGRPYLPFAWNGVSVHAVGATTLRVRATRNATANVGSVGITLNIADGSGAPVADIEALTLRALSTAGLGNTAGQNLYRLEWSAAPAGSASASAEVPGWVVADSLDGSLDGSPAGEVAECVLVEVPAGVHQALGLVREWLAEERFASSRLVLVTRGAVAVAEVEDVDPAQAAVWGLVRAAQAEQPGRFVLLDVEAGPLDPRTIGRALASGEAQVAIRSGALWSPRLARAAVPQYERLEFGPESTVLVTGGTGGLGALVAKHLATTYQVKHLLLASRRGEQAPGAAELAAELTELGATVTVAACDVGDRDALAGLIAAIPVQHPLSGVVHTAGVLDDGVITALTPERLDRVMRPKADAAWHLHELTRHLDLSAFVLFSSLSGVLGGAGQSNYAAANAFLDALAEHRRSQGMAGTSLAWGLWESGGMAEELTEADLRRMERMGLKPLSAADGLALFDAGLNHDLPALVAARFVQARTTARTAMPRAGALHGLTERLAAMEPAERQAALSDLVRGQAAMVLGFADPSAIEPQRQFQDLGFDSLTAVEFRNRLSAVTGLRLPATLVFDYPTSIELIEYLVDHFDGAEDEEAQTLRLFAEIDKIESTVTGLAEESVARNRLVSRLKDLLTGLNGLGAADHFETATDDEMFAFIDNELEVS
ncbi:type I polyketide synthase, partial [Streptosporangium sp. NPDC023963]|uniref:type I polyketide synthase n=1 Tax=Streptosporangium sp. NPDC023963 TaxID=3155608 RepID=UPI0034489A0A